MVPTQGGNSNGPEPTYANGHQGHHEGITTLATAIIPFSGPVVSIIVTLSLVPLQLGADQVRPLAYPAIFLIDLRLIVYTVPGSGQQA